LQSGTGDRGHPGFTEAAQQLAEPVEEDHSMTTRYLQTVIQQHALGAVEAPAVNHVIDVHVRAQCQNQRQLPGRCSLITGVSSALITSSTGRPRCWGTCDGCLKRWSKNSRT